MLRHHVRYGIVKGLVFDITAYPVTLGTSENLICNVLFFTERELVEIRRIVLVQGVPVCINLEV